MNLSKHLFSFDTCKLLNKNLNFINCLQIYKASYKLLTQDPTLQLNRTVNQTIDKSRNENLLPRKTTEGLKINNTKKQKFYITPKIHGANNSGRPMINPTDYHT